MSEATDRIADRYPYTEVFTPVKGWDALGGWVFAKGRIDGERGRPKHKKLAAAMLAGVAEAAIGWTPIQEWAPAVPQDIWDGAWEALYPIDDKYGVAPDLIAVVDELHHVGEWRYGGYEGIPEWFACGYLVAKVSPDGEVVGMVAPCLRTDLVASKAA